ncbi:phage portal protein [Cryobacterium sp. Hh7]|uniref:phage portal protein n=1 Tax=Cryobacterium sp. Hh7 TaxID=1259159 RepID=UPI00141B9AF5|nr:phage portal protein [Cryobacterium sp. Hh7]
MSLVTSTCISSPLEGPLDYLEALRLTNRIYARLVGRRPVFDRREQYYEGKQPLSFATEEWKKANAARYTGFSDNWTRPVVDAEGERIKHTGLKLGKGMDAAAEKLWNQWLYNEMEMQSSQGFVSSLITSRSFVIVWGDSNDEPTITWEHASDVEIEYDWANPRIRKAALKTWADEKLEYATLYTPDQVWKFQRSRSMSKDDKESQAEQAKVNAVSEGGWVPRQLADEPWPLPNPIGVVPVVEIPNRPMLRGDPVSEIQGVMPMQDAINLLWAYLFLSADYASMPARVVLHQGPPMTPILDTATGKEIGKKAVDMKDLAEKRLLYLSGADTSIDSWDAAKLDVFTDTIEIAVGHIAAQTRTPPTYLVSKTGMSNVNGEGLKASEIGLVKKTLEFQTFATPALREVYRLVALAMGDQQLAQATRLATVAWMNPEIRSESQLADALVKKKQMGYPLEYLMEVDGLDPLEVKRVLAMAARESEEAMSFGVQAAIDSEAPIEPTP